MPFDRGRGLTELWVAAGRAAHRGCTRSRSGTSGIRLRQNQGERAGPAINREARSRTPAASTLPPPKESSVSGRPSNKVWMSSAHFELLTTRARRTARRTGGRPLREGGADWPLAWPIGRSRGVCSQSFLAGITCSCGRIRTEVHNVRPPARLTSARARSPTPGRVSGPPRRTTYGDGSFIPAGRVETLPAELTELGRGRLSRRLPEPTTCARLGGISVGRNVGTILPGECSIRDRRCFPDSATISFGQQVHAG
jgi:hypothetical protein